MSASVFPARAGMSPVGASINAVIGCVPRASGDEPGFTIPKVIGAGCSPRERG